MPPLPTFKEPRPETLRKRLTSTTKSYKKKSQQLRTDQDQLNDRWIELLRVEQELEDRHAFANWLYPKRNLLSELDGEADGNVL